MKKYTGILIATLLLGLIFVVTGCPQKVESVSASERMAMFRDDLNAGNLGNLKGHTHPLTVSYALANTAYWAVIFPLTGNLTYTMSGNSATAIRNGIAYTFDLKEDVKDVYKIYKIVNTTSSSTVFQ